MTPFDRLARLFFEIEDRLFDVVAGIDTRGAIAGPQLQTGSPYKAHATAYHAVWCRNVRRVIMESRRLGYHHTTFVDVGCGMGKACFYASRFDFDRVVGLDFDERLIRKANENRLSFRYSKPDIEFLVADAAEYLIPIDRESLVFMFNPFDAAVMKIFIENNRSRFLESRSILAYANDLEKDVLVEAGMEQLFRETERKLSLWRFS